MYWAEEIDGFALLEIGYEGEVLDLLYSDTVLGPCW